MSRSIVITSIFAPTKAVEEFSKQEGYRVIVVGDKKTPSDWNCPGVEFIPVEEQARLGFRLPMVLPYNHYCRKMVGYLFAIHQGADIIIDSDDDNRPKPGWGFPAQIGTYDYIPRTGSYINVYKYFTEQDIWPRGFPLEALTKSVPAPSTKPKAFQVGIWQGLADGDPDVDAIYRLTTGNRSCIFNYREPLVVEEGDVCPFNSQNTSFVRALFPLLYLPAYVSFRFTDILRGLVAQPIMWLMGYRLGFTSATVHQDRNVHNYFEDFISELPMYLNAGKVVDLVGTAISAGHSPSDNLLEAYKALYSSDIVLKRELLTLRAWLRDLES